MGLDMYMKGRKFFAFNAKTRLEEGFEVEAIEVKLGYWRKHPNLHGYIVQTFAAGRDECQEIELDITQLQTIIEAVQARQLPKTEGFFFGKSATKEDEIVEEMKDDLEILAKCVSWLTRLEERDKECWYSVIYHASW